MKWCFFLSAARCFLLVFLRACKGSIWCEVLPGGNFFMRFTTNMRAWVGILGITGHKKDTGGNGTGCKGHTYT